MRSNWFFAALFLSASVSCGDAQEAVSLSASEGPPKSIENIAPPPDPEPPVGCDTVACCEDKLELTSGPCATVKVVGGQCTVETSEDGASCGDADACVGAPTCQGGECVANGLATDCSDLLPGPCQTAVCNPETGGCELSDLDDGSECGDGDVCNGAESCQGGVCIIAGEPLFCDDDNGCTSDTCDKSDGCVFAPKLGDFCNDSNVCTTDDVCTEQGQCEGTPGLCPCTGDGDCAGKGALCDAPLVCGADGQCAPSGEPGKTCDDGDQCTADACDPATGQCAFSPSTGACDDGDKCTAADKCGGGGCAGIAKKCDDGDPCTEGESCDADNGECTPGKYVCEECQTVKDCPAIGVCAGEYACQNGDCVLLDGSGIDCSGVEALPCHEVLCDNAQAACVQNPNAEGVACDDGNACTTGEACSGGECKSTVSLICDDKNACTKDTCEPGVGCVYAPTSGGECQDGNACTTGDTCVAGQCQGSAPKVCDDKNQCTGDSCDPQKGCVNLPIAGLCDDGDECTVGDLCSAAGDCFPGVNECGCQSDSECIQDDDVCNGTLICVEGDCVTDPTTIIDCGASSSACFTLECVPSDGSCVEAVVVDPIPCDDADNCTSGDVCQGGACKGVTTQCDDGKPCTADACVAGQGCVYTPTDGPCEDGDLCTTGETCQTGSCSGGVAVDCKDDTACTSDFCLPSVGCKHSPAVGSCNDKDACTTDDACINGVCTGKAKICDDNEGSVCNPQACDAVSGNCEATPVVCVTPDKCTEAVCDEQAGGCVNQVVVCDDSLPCTTDSCQPDSGCVFAQMVCDDGLACTLDECVAGDCVATVKTCNDDSKCTTDSCDDSSGECVFESVTCTDENACTTDTCEPVAGCQYPVINCDDQIDCTADSCDINAGCINTADHTECDDGKPCTDDFCSKTAGGCTAENSPDGSNCEDGDGCTSQDICAGGACKSGPLVCGPCVGKTQGEGCDDNDPDTVADICVAGKCAGFTQYAGSPEDFNEGSGLDRVTYTGGAFYALGSDDKDGGRGYLVQLGADGATTVHGSTLVEDDVYTDITGQAAVSSGGAVAFLDGGDWTLESTLADIVAASPSAHAGARAVWGGTEANNGKAVYYLSGRHDGPSWLVRCKPEGAAASCVDQGFEFGTFATFEIPRALHGWAKNDTSDGGVMLLSDFTATGGENSPYFNDAFDHTGFGGSLFGASYFDVGGSDAFSMDVHGPGPTELWWVGTHGLIRRHKPQLGINDWSFLSGVLGDQQSSWHMQGVWASSELVLTVATRATFGGHKLALITHDVSAGDTNSWHNLELASLDAPTPCNGENCNGGDLPELPGHVADVWMANGIIVITGWIYDANFGSTQMLYYVRQP